MQICTEVKSKLNRRSQHTCCCYTWTVTFDVSQIKQQSIFLLHVLLCDTDEPFVWNQLTRQIRGKMSFLTYLNQQPWSTAALFSWQMNASHITMALLVITYVVTCIFTGSLWMGREKKRSGKKLPLNEKELNPIKLYKYSEDRCTISVVT